MTALTVFLFGDFSGLGSLGSGFLVAESWDFWWLMNYLKSSPKPQKPPFPIFY